MRILVKLITPSYWHWSVELMLIVRYGCGGKQRVLCVCAEL